MEYYSAIKRKEWPIYRHSFMGECENNYAEWKPDQTEKPYMEWVHCISLENVNYSDKVDQWLLGNGAGGWGREEL